MLFFGRKERSNNRGRSLHAERGGSIGDVRARGPLGDSGEFYGAMCAVPGLGDLEWGIITSQ